MTDLLHGGCFFLSLLLKLDRSGLVFLIFAEFDLAVRVIPLAAGVTAHPELTIHLCVVSLAKVDLSAVVADLVLEVALIAVLTKADPLVLVVELDLGEVSLLKGEARSLLLCWQLYR